MTDVILVYPFYKRRFDNSPFRFPPLGLGYIASFLIKNGFSVRILDGTFKKETELVNEIRFCKPRVVGIYSMYSIDSDSTSIAEKVKDWTDLLVAGGPSPTFNPITFLNYFDVVAIGEGENTMLEITKSISNGDDIAGIDGVAIKDGKNVVFTSKRKNIEDIDSIPFPERNLFDNEMYMNYHRKFFGQTVASMISSRGCPYDCDFCSRPIFGNTLRVRTPENVVNEMEILGKNSYDTIWFADDCFTIHKDRVMKICDDIINRGLSINWQCLSRVDSIDSEMATRMREAGCRRIYFGIESGDDRILRTIMKKGIDTKTARKAVVEVNSSKIETGGFFIIGYPGENNDSILKTINFATSLPFDYVSFTLPYPIPGTGLYKKVKGGLIDYKNKKMQIINHNLLFDSDFSEFKLKFAIIKGSLQFRIRKYFGFKGFNFFGVLFEKITDIIFRILK